MIKKHFKKESLMNSKVTEDFEKSVKYCICENGCVGGDVKIRDCCHITKNYRGSTHRDCNIKVKFLSIDSYGIPQPR